METRKQKLITGLNRVITALQNDTINYNWEIQQSCNCGVVAQSVLGVNHQTLRKMWLDANMHIQTFKQKTEDFIDPTWKNGVKYLCPMTGEPIADVFKKLFEAGLSKEDIVHLEYMNNISILNESKIDVTKKYYKDKTVSSTITETSYEPRTFFLWRLLGLSKSVKTEKVITSKEKELAGYYTQKDNLILYLTAWVKILQGGSQKDVDTNVSDLSKTQLETELLVAVADEKFEYASVLRDQINAKIKQ